MDAPDRDRPAPYAGPKRGVQIAVASWALAERTAREQGRAEHADKLAQHLDAVAPYWRDRTAWLLEGGQ